MNKPTAVTIALLSLSLTATAIRDESAGSFDQAARIQSVKVNSAARSVEVQKMGLSGQGVTVAIIDTGVDTAHTDLAGAVVDEACFAANRGCPNGASQQFGAGAARDDNGHGTHVAGIIAGRGKTAPEGLAPNARIIAIKVAAADARNSRPRSTRSSPATVEQDRGRGPEWDTPAGPESRAHPLQGVRGPLPGGPVRRPRPEAEWRIGDGRCGPPSLGPDHSSPASRRALRPRASL